MPDKNIGQVDPTGNYGMSQAEADKARAWAKEKAKEINADPSIPRRHRAHAEHQAKRERDGGPESSRSVTERDGQSVTPAESKKARARARAKAYRARKKD